VPFNGKVGRLADDGVYFRKEQLFEIDNGSAFAADKVVVGRGFGFVAVEGAAGVDFFDEALFDQHGKVPVNGAKAEVWEFGFQHIVEPSGSGMRGRSAKHIEQTFALSAVAKGFW